MKNVRVLEINQVSDSYFCPFKKFYFIVLSVKHKVFELSIYLPKSLPK